jgi:hypothetical protein
MHASKIGTVSWHRQKLTSFTLLSINNMTMSFLVRLRLQDACDHIAAHPSPNCALEAGPGIVHPPAMNALRLRAGSRDADGGIASGWLQSRRSWITSRV